MDFGRIVKLLVVVGVVFLLWKYVVPMVKSSGRRGDTRSTVSSGSGSCVQSAERASEEWGSGLRQFANPPYDSMAWSVFRGKVESKIGSAERDCGCDSASCEKSREAMRDLRSLVGDFESTIRNGSSASDFVQRQESIDNKINDAGALARDGK
ncbi:MAG TPA: hypothetical protein VNI54_05565 [Thermoanaerobaculia bacterium]|nr:hypothetical protein [Thermoanaerobaculia bacterium]